MPLVRHERYGLGKMIAVDIAQDRRADSLSYKRIQVSHPLATQANMSRHDPLVRAEDR